MIRKVAELKDSYDLVVGGAGAGGMAAALFAAIAGKSVLLIERTEYLGGTSALSGGTTWVPNTHHSRTVNPDDTPEAALRFLDGAVGNHASRAMRKAFLASAPQAIAELEAASEVKFRPYATHPDYEQQFEGATLRGRALEPLPFDGRALGPNLRMIRPPIPEFTLFGGMMVDRTDINHLLNLKSSAASFRHAARILLNYGRDRLTGSKRGSRLVMGNALIGRFLKSLLDRGVDIVTVSRITALLQDGGRVTGVSVESGGVRRTIASRHGVVLAAGGYGRSPRRRAAMLPSPTPPHSPAAPGHTGELQDLAIGLGARFGEGGQDNAFWAPVSIRRRADGTTAVFPHFVMDRSKPGTLCVDGRGARFVNEATSYHSFARAMLGADGRAPVNPATIITDSVGLKKYGLGMVRIGAKDISGFLADGYLTEAATVTELARKLGMDTKALEGSVAAINHAAETGVDPDFGRGATAYHRVNGDAKHPGPNPTLGRIGTPPFYAVRLYPGDIGAATGLAITPDAEVLGAGDQPIAGLYACGAEAQSIMGGAYPGPGITIGPAIVFAWRAARHAISSLPPVGRVASEASRVGVALRQPENSPAPLPTLRSAPGHPPHRGEG